MTSKDFSVKYLKVNEKKNNLNFEISGNNEYGLNKTIINAIRRTLLTDIETVAFNPEDIIIKTNNSALHNEFMKHRISLIPLYIKPEKYYKKYLFVLKVKNTDIPVKSIYANDFEIYELKDEIKQKIDEVDEYTPDEENILLKLNNISTEYYDLNKPLPDSKKEKIFRPFKFNGKSSYFLLTELKLTGSDDDIQELEIYCSPSLGTSRQHARFNNLSKVVYSFKHNKKVFDKVVKDNIKINKIKGGDVASYHKSLELKEGERYFYRDVVNEPYWYNFSITSNHVKTCKEVYLQSLDILNNRLNHIIENLKTMVSDPEESLFSFDRLKNEMTYQIVMAKEDDTTGNMIQAHMANKFISGESVVQVSGYKKPHPLTDLIIFNLMIKPTDYTEKQKKSYIAEFFMKVCKDLIDILDIMKREASKKL